MSRPTLPGRMPVVPSSRPESERGQMLTIFALAMVALIAMVGLIIDGGDTFLQRRDQQNVADAAAMAAGYASVNGLDVTAAAQTVAAANGYQDGQDGTTVTVSVGSGSITVDVSRPHRNYFSGVVGFASWGVSTTASVQAGIPNAAYGVMPLIFNRVAFNAANKIAGISVSFSEPGIGTADVPTTETSFNWTLFCTASGNPCNGDSNGVKQIVDGNGTGTTIRLTDDIGPLNAGAHTDLFDALASKVGASYPVSIVNDEGEITGWAYFHLTGSVGGSTKKISGWFEDPIEVSSMTILPNAGVGAEAYGSYVVELTN